MKNPFSKLAGYLSIAENINKAKGEEQQIENSEGVISNLEPELNLSMSDNELIALKENYEKTWENSQAKKTLEEKQKTNEDYWKGKHFTLSNDDRPLIDNLIFEAVETFLPMITRQKPEPIVEADNTIEGNELADKVQKMLSYQMDRERLKLKLQKVARYWALYYLGVIKVGWNYEENDVAIQVIRPQKLILDPSATINECVYTGEFIGEKRQEKASILIERFPKKRSVIEEEVNGKLGTKVQFVEWWTNEYVFWTMKNEVLFKSKNPHWNYFNEVKKVDEYGKEEVRKIDGKNHFNFPKKPYVFLSVFNLGKHPFDETTIIEQNLAIQDTVNKRLRQIDKNADNTNSGLIVSGDHYTKDQASQVDNALRNGGTIWVPNGKVGDAVTRTQSPPLPSFVYESLIDYRNEIRNIFGIRGATPQGIINEQTVRGKIMIKGQDADRSSLITEHLEQFCDEVYNWLVQLMYVYYDEDHVAAVIGKERAKEYISLRKDDFNTKLIVSVKEGSMIPHDRLTERNAAIELFTAGLLDPITAFEKLDFPNPREAAEKLFKWKQNPESLFANNNQSIQQNINQQPIISDQKEIPQQIVDEQNQDVLNQIPIPQ